jgi:uncharacterized membrane protein
VGLDAVELVMEIEEEFGIAISDDEAIHTLTLGQLHDYLLERCAGRRRTDCPVRSAFYRLRRALVAVLGVGPRPLRPSTPLLPLLGNWRLHRTWRQLERELSLKLPPLENRAGVGVVAGMAVVSVVGFVAATARTGDVFVGLGVALLCLLPGTLLGYIFGLCWHTVSQSYRTLGELARGLVAYNYERFRPAKEPSTTNDPIWERLCNVVVRQLGVEKVVLNRGTRFVEDLGI